MNTFKKMFSNTADKVLLGIFLSMSMWILIINILGIKYTLFNYLYAFVLAVLPTVGAVIGFIRTKQWGGIYSKVGRATFLVSFGLAFWALGSYIWSYYNYFLNVELPYPSWADVGYAPAYLWWGIGIIALTTLTSVKDSDRPLNRILFFCIPLMMAIVTYYIVHIELHSGESFFNTINPGKLLVDTYYPLADVCILATLAVCSSLELNFLGRRLRLPLMIIVIGFVLNYIADFYFAYTTIVGTYYVGEIADWLFTVSMFILSLGVSNLHPKLLKD